MGTKLGQNFLKHQGVAARVAEAAKITPRDTVLEVGPGRGILTAELLARAARVIAIEKDEKLVGFLAGRFAAEIAAKKLILIRGDALEFNPANYQLKTNSFLVVANIPYYITGQLIRRFLEAAIQPASMTLLIQKEVAERIVAKPPHTNLLALSVQCYGTPRIAFKVGRGNFNPPPNVDSAVITTLNISHDFFKQNKISEKDFFTLLHAGFAQKRKQLAGNIAIIAGGKERATRLLAKCGIAPKARAENLSLVDWAKLASAL
ncbi:MAG: ribosomal RNA small subunit methyltransferase A [Candidatus Niyogibacteria bacterium]|nr:ribosomal RNA small subunit methyltransferase A [Candidatus Niyogibacteria bacterium]